LETLAKSFTIQVWRFRRLDGKGKSDPLVERVRPIPLPNPPVDQSEERAKIGKDSRPSSSNSAGIFEHTKAIQVPIRTASANMLNKLKTNDI
jgi:hypothetical protein